MRSFALFQAFSILISSAVSTPTPEHHQVSLPLPSRVVYEFPNQTWIENLAVRSNGQLLLDVLTSPDLYLLDPNVENSEPALLYTFPGTLALFGIAELQHDIFYVISGNYSETVGTGPGTYVLWKVDLNHGPTPAVSILTGIPEASLLNGVVAINGTDAGDILLVSDSNIGVVWKVDVNTAKYEIIYDYPEMKHPANSSLPIGINGIKVRDNYVYWTNSELALLCRIEIDCTTLAAIGGVQVLATNIPGLPDDFTFDARGNVWVTLDEGSELGFIKAGQNTTTVVLGSPDQLTIPGPTSAQFGRTQADKDIVYVATNGGLAAPINGTITEGGKVVAVDTKGYW